ncbi:MAG: ferritin-like domain-containing protein [Ancalomicrobiaceae bacterium]|nr:ferritin-like domain-containing protein [Ancalomicrobiaceae bacterium]
MHATHNSTTIDAGVQSVEVLNRHLAAAIDLHAPVKQAHWHVRGPGFSAVHDLFDRGAGTRKPIPTRLPSVPEPWAARPRTRRDGCAEVRR